MTDNRKYFIAKRKLTGKIAGRLVKKLAVTLAAGMVGVLLAETVPARVLKIVENRQEQTAVTAWWGTLYPKFCFSQLPAENKEKKDDIKISFWLAQALDW